jgi:flagellar biosynthesis anti-sigma factor FlgM
MEVSPKTLSVTAGTTVSPMPETARSGNATPVAAGLPPTGDKVSLSDKAREVRQAVSALEKIPDVRDDKVEAIRARMASGTYDINGERIADKLMHESLINALI